MCFKQTTLVFGLAQTKKGFNALLVEFTACMFVVGPFKRMAVIFIRSKTKYDRYILMNLLPFHVGQQIGLTYMQNKFNITNNNSTLINDNLVVQEQKHKYLLSYQVV